MASEKGTDGMYRKGSIPDKLYTYFKSRPKNVLVPYEDIAKATGIDMTDSDHRPAINNVFKQCNIKYTTIHNKGIIIEHIPDTPNKLPTKTKYVSQRGTDGKYIKGTRSDKLYTFFKQAPRGKLMSYDEIEQKTGVSVHSIRPLYPRILRVAGIEWLNYPKTGIELHASNNVADIVDNKVDKILTWINRAGECLVHVEGTPAQNVDKSRFEHSAEHIRYITVANNSKLWGMSDSGT
jgi:hypothetical protein